MEKDTLATEVITEMQDRLINVVSEIDSLDIDCEHALFIITEIMETISKKPIETEKDVYDMFEKMDRIDSLCGIAYDYVSKIQSSISDIVIRERSGKHNKGED
ncbi:MAG: hypothetical protein ACLU8C_07635 [Lacrimispora saccharolytica]